MSDIDSWLVTGGAGFIGSNFVRYWRQQYPDDRIVVVDALTYAGNRHSLADMEQDAGFTFVQGDITDQALIESPPDRLGPNDRHSPYSPNRVNLADRPAPL